jgi:hypothetical protein
MLCRTLQKTHAYVEGQQDASRIKRLFQQNTTKTLLKECEAGLQTTLAVFKVAVVQARAGNSAQLITGSA